MVASIAGPVCLLSAAGFFCFTQYKLIWSGRQENLDHTEENPWNSPKFRTKITKIFVCTLMGFSITGATAAISHMVKFSAVVIRNSYAVPSLVLLCATGASLMGKKREEWDTSSDFKRNQAIVWLLSNIAMGILLSPVGFLGSTVVLQAAVISAGLGVILCAIPVFAPGKEYAFLNQQAKTILLTLFIASSVAYLFPGTAMAYGLDRASLYGSILISGLCIMQHTHEVIERVKRDTNLNPLQESLLFYQAGLSLFTRMTHLSPSRA